MTETFDALVKSCQGLGYDEVPSSGGTSNPEAEKGILAIFNAYPGKKFSPSMLAGALAKQNVTLEKPGNLLFAMMNAKKVSRPVMSWYCKYDSSIVNARKSGRKVPTQTKED